MVLPRRGTALVESNRQRKRKKEKERKRKRRKGEKGRERERREEEEKERICTTKLTRKAGYPSQKQSA